MPTVRDITQIAEKYSDYTVEIDTLESTLEPWYEGRGPDVLRVHCRFFRVPSMKKIVLRHFATATAADRAEAEALLPWIRQLFESWEMDGKATKRRHRTKNTFYWSVCAGSLVDDPLMQLELEMMLDLVAEETA